MPTDSEVVPDPSFEPHIFWEQHKQKLVIYGSLLLGALLIFAIYQYTTEQRKEAAGAALAQAAKADDYKSVMEKYPRTIAAGDAALLLARNLREEKKYD